MNLKLRRPLTLAIALVVLTGAVGFRLGLAESAELQTIKIESYSTANDWHSVLARRALTVLYRSGRVVYLAIDGYHEFSVPKPTIEDLFVNTEADARSWSDHYVDPGATSVLSFELGGLGRTIEVGDLYASNTVPASLRSIIAATGRWVREGTVQAKAVESAPIVVYLLPAPAGAEGPDYALPDEFDADAASRPGGLVLDASALAKIQTDLPVVGSFTQNNTLLIGGTDSVDRQMLVWNVAWDKIIP